MADLSTSMKPRRVMGVTIDLAVRLAGTAPQGRRRAEGEPSAVSTSDRTPQHRAER